MEAGPMLIFIVLVVFLIVAAIYGAIAAQKRRDEMLQLAARLGLSFDPSKDYQLAERFGFLDKLAQGSNRYAFNVLSGAYMGEQIAVFDYHYETHSTDSKGRRQTHHHYLSAFTLELPIQFPELRIYQEGLFSKIGQFLGYDDIDFESAEFSRAFCVRSKDKKFAYDFCHARTIEYLLANRDLSVEVETSCLALLFGTRLAPSAIEPNLARLSQLRSLMPQYLFQRMNP